MKKLGIFLIATGLVWGIVAFNMSTTVETGGQLIGSGEYSYRVPKGLVHNIGLIDQRRNHIIISAVLIVSGIILFGFGAVIASRKPIAAATELHVEVEGLIGKDQKKCPSCAESIKLEALKCKHCGEIFDPSDIKKEIEKQKINIAKPIIGDKRMEHKDTWKYVLVFLLIGLSVIVVFMFTGNRGEEKKAEDTIKVAPPVAAPTLPTSKETGRNGRFIDYDNGTVMDTRTNLMWAAKDNGSDINWANAKSYCENYRGGGYTDWRMPTQDELAGLYDANKSQQAECGGSPHHVATELIHLSCWWGWASETRGSDATGFNFGDGKRGWFPQSNGGVSRALPVRSGK